MATRQFDKDASALVTRIHAHERYGMHDLNSWVFNHLPLDPGMSVLELGCGTGRQTLPLARQIGSTGRVVAVDASGEALASAEVKLTAEGLAARVRLVQVDFDDLAATVGARCFDRVLGVYSLYYSCEPCALFDTILRSLRPDGVLFFCGPSAENNAELKQFLADVRGSTGHEPSAGAKFMEQIAPEFVAVSFTQIKTFTFENPLRFDSPAALQQYWRAYSLYDPSLDSEFEKSANRYFERHQTFTTVKRVVGIRAAKP
jgi:ubiquinone/menaquinone biosynthesis C-methylase UbiE